ncbi:HAMP domain-containing histidine kinase [Thalassospira sp. HF15]|uniref:sensor histidine kinase n=1 Tax=Thalassospira sp. HF15 TaxID=2722755 RepID=UPI0014302229|nr:HAMP domain-containing sensor histidine kinase [Thalassospira sp. HF15]NIY74737.1 HAMP domain-containing histidine kinase [Thalassospira sp. HF15]
MTETDPLSMTDQNVAIPLVDGRESRWFQNGYFWRVTGVLALTGALLFFGLIAVWIEVESSREDEQTVRSLVVDVTHRSADIRQWYETSIQTLHTSMLNPAIQNFEARPDEVINYFRKLAMEVQRFSQLRVLLPSGMEAVRVDARGQDVLVMSQEELQDKSDRYYFEAAETLRPGQVYVSKLDLNVENGEIEQPLRPTARLVAPITTADQSIVGYLVVNLDMATPLATFGAARGTDSRTELFNPEGYWLAGEQNGLNWGFMLEAGTTIASSYPDLWHRIASVEAQAGFEFEDRLYEVETLPVEKLLSSVSGGIVLAEEPRLHLVSSAPSYQAWSGNITIMLVFVAFMLALIFVVSGGIGYLMLRRRQAVKLQALLTRDLMVQGRHAALGRIVAGVSHEMRTPLGNALTVSTTMSEDLEELQQCLMKAGEVDQERMEMIEALLDGNRILQKNIQRTRNLLKHFNQTATDQTVHTQRVFDLAEVITDLVKTLRNQLAKTGVQLSTTLPQTAQMNSYSDAVDQVILSLIMNAHQHAFVGREKGVISIRVSARDADYYLVEVADDGIGISSENQDRIFEPFYSLEASSSGTGLGLAIVMNVVQNTLGGQIKVSSMPGAGTVFQITLPRTAPTRVAKQESSFAVEDEPALASPNPSGTV